LKVESPNLEVDAFADYLHETLLDKNFGENFTTS